MLPRFEVVLLSVASLLLLPGRAAADESGGPTSHLHATVAVGHALGQPQSHELGWGPQIGLAYELRLASVLGLEVGVDAVELTKGDPPADPRFAPRTQGAMFDGFVAARLTPLAKTTARGPWLELGAGVGATGSLVRPVVESRLGWDVLAVDKSNLKLGPFVGFTEVFQPGADLRPEDAHLLWVGIAGELGLTHRGPARPDRDHDGVFDDEDACPDIPGVRTDDPRTNGCPAGRADRDKDTIFDDEDACPDVPGVRTDDPKTNGCPPDRDHDGVFDAEDACPDVPGVRTSDPKTNGCPLPQDRDKDGVLDNVDACPDVPGIPTNDPKTNGCPKPTDKVRVEGDQILLGDLIFFDTGSPRVRHQSWPILQRLAKYFEDNPDIEQVDIEGHADEVGTNDYNDYISRERAASVKRLLVKFGVDPAKLTTHAYGEARPREPGHDEKAHRENRRVEFTITQARAGTNPATPQAPAEKPKEGP